VERGRRLGELVSSDGAGQGSDSSPSRDYACARGVAEARRAGGASVRPETSAALQIGQSPAGSA